VTSIGLYAFEGCSGLANITISKNMTQINDYAFKGCTGLVEITIPTNITSIRGGAFGGCTGLTSIVIPDSVTSIGSGAFGGCSSLTSITIPFLGANKAGTGDKYFSYIFGDVPASLKEVVVLSGTTIPNYAFSNCSNLENIMIPNNVTSIGSSAFSGCSSLVSIKIPDSVTSIGASAFKGCSGLVSVTLPNGITSISSSTFENCSSLTDVKIPDSVTTIDIYVFQGCSSLTKITIPDSVRSIGSSAFSGCSSLIEITIPDSVQSIKNSVFNGCSSLESITLPFIGVSKTNGTTNNHFGYIFGASSYSSNVTFVPASLKTVVITGGSAINDYAFYGCNSLENITIPSTVTRIGNDTFYGCSSLSNVTISYGVTSIGFRAFMGCTSLESVTIPNSVIGIGKQAFADCSSLASITLPYVGQNGVSNSFLGYVFGASYYSENAQFVPASLKFIKLTHEDGISNYAFYGCNNIEHIELSPYATSIGSYAFAGCTSLTSVVMPTSLNSIGAYAFAECVHLKGVYVPSGVTTIVASTFDGCTGLERVTLQSGLVKIESNAFSGCSSLTTVNYTGCECQWAKVNCQDTTINALTVTCAEHSFGDGVVTIEPSCEGVGEMTYTCVYGTVTKTEEIPAVGHTEKVVPGYEASAGVEGLTDGVSCSVCGAVLVAQEIIPAKPVEEFKIASAYLNLTKDINMMWRTKVPSGYENPYMVFTLNGVSYTATSYTLDEQGRLCFMFPGVMPHQLGDNIRATLYATVDGELVSVVKDNYSIKDYAAYILANYPAGSETATLMSDIMVYGEKLQLYRGYKTDALVTEGLTLSPSEFKTLDDTKNKLSLVGTPDDDAKWKGAGLYLENAMSVRFSFTATDIEGLTVEITINGRKTVYNASELTKESDGQYKIYFRGISASEFDDEITAIFKRNGEQVGRTVTYSVNSYVHYMQNSASNEKLVALIKAIYSYGASADGYTS